MYYIFDLEDGVPVDRPKSPTSTPVQKATIEKMDSSNDDNSNAEQCDSDCDSVTTNLFSNATAMCQSDSKNFAEIFIQPFMIAHHGPGAYEDALYNVSQSVTRGAFNFMLG